MRLFQSEYLTFGKIFFKMTADTATVYDQIAEFMASMSPQKVMTFKASDLNQKRLDFLLDKQGAEGLSEGEKRELEHYLIINRIVGLAKARAKKLLEQ